VSVVSVSLPIINLEINEFLDLTTLSKKSPLSSKLCVSITKYGLFYSYMKSLSQNANILALFWTSGVVAILWAFISSALK
jgi:hypothetical protein